MEIGIVIALLFAFVPAGLTAKDGSKIPAILALNLFDLHIALPPVGVLQ